MTLKRRILLGILGVFGVALASLAIALSYNASCPSLETRADDRPTMRAVVSRCYGGPETLRVESIPKPVPGERSVLVKVHAASVNPLDWHYMRGEPYLMRLSAGIGRPNDAGMGVDFAGTVEAVGASVTRFAVGDAVFGGRGGSLAEYLTVREDGSIIKKPDNVSFEAAAAAPIAAVTALQALRDRGALREGQNVLVNGASGGVGTYAIQIAKALGANVTGVCSTRNVAMVKSLGADRVIDYTQTDFTKDSVRYDLIVDNVGNHSLSAIRGVLEPNGRHVIVGTTSREPWLGPIIAFIKAAIVAPFVEAKSAAFVSSFNARDFEALVELMQADKVRSVIDRRFALEQSAEAITYLETGRARGKVIVTVVPEP